MTCASCVRRVEQAILAVPGVASAAVNLATERADVSFHGALDAQAVIAAVKDAGYESPPQTIEIGIDGMTCASCVRRVEKSILAVPGVLSAAVNLATETATIDFLPQSAGMAVIEAAIGPRDISPAARRLRPMPLLPVRRPKIWSFAI